MEQAQVALDREDVVERLERMFGAQRAVYLLQREVKELTSKLRVAKRKLREAGWAL